LLPHVRPTPEERDEINRTIMDELVYGVFKPSSVQYFQKIMQKMKGAGCDARLLARAALRRSLQDR
jgi:aspartate racemase